MREDNGINADGNLRLELVELLLKYRTLDTADKIIKTAKVLEEYVRKGHSKAGMVAHVTLTCPKPEQPTDPAKPQPPPQNGDHPDVLELFEDLTE